MQIGKLETILYFYIIHKFSTICLKISQSERHEMTTTLRPKIFMCTKIVTFLIRNENCHFKYKTDGEIEAENFNFIEIAVFCV